LSAVSANQPQDVAWLLQGLTEEVPGIRGSVLLSSDGMVKAARGLDRDNSERLAALASSFFSLARGAGALFDGSDKVRQVVTELPSSQLYICWAGFNSVLAVLTTNEAEPAVVGFQMAQLIKAVRPFLDTAARSAAPADNRNR